MMMAYNVEAGDASGVSVKALLGTAGVSEGLAARVAAADADGSGVLSLAELVSVFRSEDKAIKEKKMMRRCVRGPWKQHTRREAPAGCRNQGPPNARRIALAAVVLVVVLRGHDGHHLRRGGSEQGFPRCDARQGQRCASVHRWGRGGVGWGLLRHHLDLNSHPGFAAIHLPGVDVCLLSTPQARR
jgi:hypothetical protein